MKLKIIIIIMVYKHILNIWQFNDQILILTVHAPKSHRLQQKEM